MQQYQLSEAQQQLERLLNDAQDGETVVIIGEHNRAVRLVPVKVNTKKKNRKPGSACGLIKMADDFDAPLSDY